MGVPYSLVKELSLDATDVTRLVLLGLDERQIRRVDELELSPSNPVHYHALYSCCALGMIDEMLEDPTVFIKASSPKK